MPTAQRTPRIGAAAHMPRPVQLDDGLSAIKIVAPHDAEQRDAGQSPRAMIYRTPRRDTSASAFEVKALQAQRSVP